MQKVVVAKGLTKRFKDVTAINDITFSMEEGSFNLLVGPNGSGKTTLERLIVGLYEPTEGSVKIFGEEASAAPVSVMAKVGYVGENYGLYDNLSVISNLLFFSRLLGIEKRQALERIDKLLSMLGAGEFVKRKVSTLSRGTKQKIAVCRALLANPRLLVLDEPTAFLDPESAEKLREALAELVKEGTTVVYATQRLDELSKFNADVLVLKKGKLVGYGDLDSVVKMIRGIEIEISYLGRLSKEQEKAMKTLGGRLMGKRIVFSIGSIGKIPKLAKEAVEAGINITSITFLDYNLR
ncbi:MAG: ABC transporter ATP-binding protein [Candidatus Micrarchaeia archaeon]